MQEPCTGAGLGKPALGGAAHRPSPSGLPLKVALNVSKWLEESREEDLISHENYMKLICSGAHPSVYGPLWKTFADPCPGHPGALS